MVLQWVATRVLNGNQDGNLIECLIVEFCQYGALFEIHCEGVISIEGYLNLSFDIG